MLGNLRISKSILGFELCLIGCLFNPGEREMERDRERERERESSAFRQVLVVGPKIKMRLGEKEHQIKQFAGCLLCN